MAKFMTDDFLLTNDTAKSLYNEVKDLPIFDYHCHLSPKEIFDDRKFFDLCELWLECDHYKWRVMRNAGVDERYITGDAQPYEKFLAFASVLPRFIGNPVYHWAHLELKKYFGITLPINEQNAKEIWDKTSQMMSNGEFSARKLIEESGVDTVITTDDPIDDLKYHEQLKGLAFEVLPCFRPDKVLGIEKKGFAEYVNSLSKVADIEICDVDTLVQALTKRLDYFMAHGTVVTDVSFCDFPMADGREDIANSALKKCLVGEEITEKEQNEYVFYILTKLCRLFADRGVVLQLHIGVIRNCNSARFAKIGADCGIDSVGNAINVNGMVKLFDCVEREGGMPRTIVYTLNPTAYYPIATALGDFAGDSAGKMQLGAAWWFMDHRDGIREQLKVFAETSGLGYFNGMLTDSRSFVSYARHDYFRRVLCSVLGEWAEMGEYPCDNSLIDIAKDICYYNAKKFFAIER